MNGLFCAMLLAGALYAAATGRLDAAQHALLSGGGEAVTLLLELAGAYAFFGGLMGILRECGAADALARTMEKPLFPAVSLCARRRSCAFGNQPESVGEYARHGRRGDAGGHGGDAEDGARQRK
ncbi:MAG: hypothetical protein V8Q79_08795 [Christensenellales bacterium]